MRQVDSQRGYRPGSVKIRRTGGNDAGRHLYTRGVFEVKGLNRAVL